MHNHRTFLRSGLAALLCSAQAGLAEPTVPPARQETSEQRSARMKWWREARFGLFVHWGVYSVPAGVWGNVKGAGEWLMWEAKIPIPEYEKLAPQFNPVKYDAREWVRLAKDAGMKYIVITARHHDGFSMWPSDLTEWGIKATPFQRDPLKELAEACQEAGIKLGFYYSIMTWNHPDWPMDRTTWKDRPDMSRYAAFMKGQLKELLTRYGPVAILWFDGDEECWTHQHGVDLYDYLRSLQPELIINNRHSRDRFEKWDDAAAGDFQTPENAIPSVAAHGAARPWETCMTMNDHWGYDKNDHKWKSAETLIRMLVETTSKDGNFLLNVGPTSEGVIPAPSVERLQEIGRWMRVNGDSIYGCGAASVPAPPWGRVTAKEGRLFFHIYAWPKDGALAIEKFQGAARKAWLLADPAKTALEMKADGETLRVSLPAAAPDPIDSVLCVEI